MKFVIFHEFCFKSALFGVSKSWGRLGSKLADMPQTSRKDNTAFQYTGSRNLFSALHEFEKKHFLTERESILVADAIFLNL